MGALRDGGAGPAPVRDDSALGVMSARLWRGRVAVLSVAFGCAAIAYGASWLAPPVYTARVTLLPRLDEQGLGLLGRFAGLTGVPMGASAAPEGLYGRIVTSNHLLDSLIVRDWPLGEGGRTGTLFEVLRIGTGSGPADSLRAHERVRDRLRRKVVSFSRDRLTGFMDLRVSLPREKRLAALLANHLAAELDRYNREFQRQRASEQSSYAETRLGEVAGDLRRAEEALAAFLRANRGYGESPDLTRRYEELRREVDAQSSIWVELKRQLEIARLDEHRQMLSIDVLDKADVPVRRSSPRRTQIAALAGLAGLIAGVCWALGSARFE